jgi:hypothetical protein
LVSSGKSGGSINAMWGSLSANQRIVAAVISALVIAAGIYRWVAFGNLNNIHGGGSSATVRFTSQSEFLPPTIAEVDQSARSNARAEGKPRHLSCHELPGNTWNCALHFVGGATVIYRGVWNDTRGTVTWPVVKREATLHFKVPIGR